MNPGIFLIQENGDLVEMNEAPYNSEDLLQTLLAKYPSLLAGNQIDPKAPRKWLFIERESAIPSMEGGGGRWSADHLFLDQDAVPTIVEVKRSSDTRIRREVVGQMLDYAANAVVYWPVDRLRERFAKTHGESADERLSEFLDDQMEAEEFWQLANKNLQDRNIRLLFVADEIPTELQRIVEFLNEQMDQTEVLAIEIKQFVGRGQTGLVPRVIGRTAEAQEKKSRGSRGPTHNEISFFQAIEENRSVEEYAAARNIFDWAKERFSRIDWGVSSFVPVLEYGSGHKFSPIDVRTSGRLVVRFGYILRRNQPFDDEDKRLELLRRLNEIPGVALSQDSIDTFPRIELSALVNGDALEKFKQTMAWTIEEVQAALQNAPNGSVSRAAQP
jgi:hypothetical protein